MASPVVYQRKRALIIGINECPCDPLRYCINDAIDLKTTLQRISFDVSSGVNCKLSEFYRIVDTFADAIQRDDLVLFYFAGHGKQMEDQNYLLPSDYNYDHRGLERDYIPNHAINVQYITKKIDDRKCRITIYIFDCCRNLIRTRAANVAQGLLPMHAPSQTLIVFACAPGKAVQDETRNNRNGSFIENFLKYIETTDRDIEELMKNVAGDVHLQTDGFQLPYRTSSLTGKVCLVTNNNQEHHPTAWLETVISESAHSSASSTDINILLLSAYNVGKATFINAFANYLVHDTLDAALQGDMQVVKPSVFNFCDLQTGEDFTIMVGSTNENECYHDPAVTQVQSCRSYNFTIGNRLLRLIDTPSILNTDNIFEYIKNMEHIFTYISQYKHLNSICIMLKATDTLEDFSFQYRCSIKELLSHLHINTNQNIMWVFTHARNNFYQPGATLTLLRSLFEDTSIVDYKFTRQNCFLFEHDAFRLLALNKDHSEIVRSWLSKYSTGWDLSRTAFCNLVTHILSCKPILVHETFFLYIARQLLIRLITDKSSLRLSVTTVDTDNTHENLEKLSMHHARVRLSQFIKLNSILPVNDEFFNIEFSNEELSKQSVDDKYLQYLKEHSINPFTNYTMEHINRSFCRSLRSSAGCTKVSEFLKVNSITSFSIYLKKYIDSYFYTKLNKQTSDSQFLLCVRESSDFSSKNSSVKYIRSMFYEELLKQTTSTEYLKFLQDNSMVSLNNTTIERICQLIFDNKSWNSDRLDSEKIRSLDNLIARHDALKNLFTANIDEQTTSVGVNMTGQVSQIKEILKLFNEICALPINGVYIRQYMEGLEKAQRDMTGQSENVVKLPASAQSSALMRKLRAILEQN